MEIDPEQIVWHRPAESRGVSPSILNVMPPWNVFERKAAAGLAPTVAIRLREHLLRVVEGGCRRGWAAPQ